MEMVEVPSPLLHYFPQFCASFHPTQTHKIIVNIPLILYMVLCHMVICVIFNNMVMVNS